jgi:hypothetical protein
VILTPFRGRLSPALYPFLAGPLLLLQHAAVALACAREGHALTPDLLFWLLPLKRLIDTRFHRIADVELALVFVVVLLSAGGVAIVSIRRAARSGFGFGLAVMAIVPGLQVFAVLLLSLLPFPRPAPSADAGDVADEAPGANAVHILQGLLSGVAVIVLAVLVSAVTFGAYGYGLFLLTPLLVGITTAYLANRRHPLSAGDTNWLVLSATALGGFSLIVLALEGIICLILAAPLAAGAALIGGVLGRAAALNRNRYDKPLMAVALLPAIFALEAAMPPAAAIASRESIDIAAPSSAVWRAVTSDAPIIVSPGLVGRAGLAYPLRGALRGEGVGAIRIGYFSTGVARERVTVWQPHRALGFAVLVQPPAMEEMSPYRRDHAPHVLGYFETGETHFILEPLRNGGTRLTVAASHVLRIDPIPYWEPIARWAAAANSRRVLLDLKRKAEADRDSQGGRTSRAGHLPRAALA